MKKHILSIETVYVLFLFSGVYKSAEFFQWFPIDLTLFFGTIAVIGSIIYLVKNGLHLTYNKTHILGLYMAILFYAIISGFWSPSRSYFQLKIFRLAFISGISLIIPLFIISASKDRLYRLGALTVILGVISAVASLNQYLLHGPWGIEPLGANYLIVGRVFGFVTLILLFFVVYNPANYKCLSVGLILITFSSLLVVGARGPLVATVVSAAFLFVLLGVYKPHLISKRAVTAYLSVGLFSIVGILSYGSQFRGVQRILQLFDGPGNSLGTRLEYYSWTLENIGGMSIIFGNGLASWPVIRTGTDSQSYPHNVFLEILFELGIIGLSMFLLFILFSMKGSIQKQSKQSMDFGLLLIVLLTYMLVNINITGDLGSNRYLFAIIGLLGYHSGINN